MLMLQCTGQLSLWRLPYLPVHKELSPDRLQKKKLSQRLSWKKKIYIYILPERGDWWAKALEEESRDPIFQQAASL